MLRDDLSNKLIHLTRGDDYQQAATRFNSIIANGRIEGGTTTIRGAYRCVCFSEAPISKLASVLSRSLQDGGTRYKAFGVMVDKVWLFERGGRPVIYQPDNEFEPLPESHRYRHVRYEPPNVDWTWEREWRIRADVLQLDPAATTFIVPDRRWSEKFINDHVANVAIESDFFGAPVLRDFQWHFIALTDLGLEVPDVPAP